MKRQNKLLYFALGASILLAPLNANALKKSETVYTNLNYDGTVAKSSVANHLSFLGNSDVVDQTELENILNLKGDEQFFKKDGTLTWSSRGNDIFYRGTIEKNIPIATTISYRLDGEEMQLEDIIGKSGHIEIVYKFKNENANRVFVNGHLETLYTPFLTTVATIIKDGSRNVEVSNGKIVNTGSRSIALGIASPGLYESTHISELSKMNTITISFDTEEFEMGTTYIVSTPKLLEDSDLAIFGKANALSNSIKELENNMLKLTEGAKQLESGANDLAVGSNTLMGSIGGAITSMEQLKSGSVALDVGVDEMISKLTAAKVALADPSNPSMTSLVTLKNQNAEAIATYAKVITSTGVDMSEVVTACAGTSHMDLLANADIKMFCLLNANNEALDSVASLISGNIDTVLGGLEELKKGSATLAAGMNQMSIGIDKLYAGSKTLVNGSNVLKDGASTLSAGSLAFKEQGIDELAEKANTLVTYSNRAEALANLSKNYKGFASTNSDETLFVSMVPSYKTR